MAYRRSYRTLGWLLFATLVARSADAAKLTVTISGVDERLENAARASLSLEQYIDRDVSEAQVARLYAGADREIRRALEPYGYYEAKVTSRLDAGADTYATVFEVAPGPLVLVTSSHVEVMGSGAALPEVQRAIASFAPRIGEPLDHAKYESSKAAIESALLGAGYLGTKLISRRVEVTRLARSAAIDLVWESGERCRFGDVRFSDAQFSDDFLRRFIPWKEGDWYSAEDLRDFQQRLVDADYFATALIQPRMDAVPTGTVPIDVTLSPAKRTIYSASAYGSTDTGAGVHLGYQRRWLNRQAHKLQIDGDYAERLQAASFSYRIPLPGRNERTLNFGTTYRDETTDTSESQTLRRVANETRKWHGFTRTLGFQLMGGDFEIGSERGNSDILFAEGVLSRHESDDPIFTRRGWSMLAGLRVAPHISTNDTSFVQLGAQTKWVRGLGETNRVITRGSVAAMTVDQFEELPPQLRFFAGGDRSIRGFDYQAIGSVNAAGDVIGGKYLVVGSAEFEHYFRPKWGGAIFVDAGDAFLESDFDLNIGVGAGLRWKSPIGVVRIDLAYPVQTEFDKSLRLHVVIGPDV
jgi:translocation and assembly module TamA